jgi:hypothetical protein
MEISNKIIIKAKKFLEKIEKYIGKDNIKDIKEISFNYSHN